HEIAEGIAAYLAAAGIVAWDERGAGEEYTLATEWPTYSGPDMPASPHRPGVLTPVTATRSRADVDTMIQIRLRGAQDDDVDEVAEKAQQIADVFYPNGFPLVHATLGRVRVGAVLPVSETTLPRDGQRRHGHSLNFRVRSRRPRPE